MGKSSLRIIIRTIFITYILTAIFLLLLAFGLYQLHLSESQVNLGINVIYIVTCFIGGVLAGKAAKVKAVFVGIFLRYGLLSGTPGRFFFNPQEYRKQYE